MGTSHLFVFCVVFLAAESVIFYSLQNSINPLFNFDNALYLLDAKPPNAPVFDNNPFAFLTNAGQAIGYVAGIMIYVIRLVASLITFPFYLASRVLTWDGQYPFLGIVNGTVILFLAYSVLSRIMGGD